MNTKNTNKELGFDKFSECNYNLHWSFSNFNRMLIAAEQIAQLPVNSRVLELGAGSSELENIVKVNFARNDIKFYKVDGDKSNKKTAQIVDITSQDFEMLMKQTEKFDAIIFMEVIEHIAENDAKHILSCMHKKWLKQEGLLILTTPTPPYDCLYEDLVWPLDHYDEYGISKIKALLNGHFKIIREIGWSLEEREYNELLSTNNLCKDVYCKLRQAYPESFIRAIISSLAPHAANRQMLFICKARRA